MHLERVQEFEIELADHMFRQLFLHNRLKTVSNNLPLTIY